MLFFHTSFPKAAIYLLFKVPVEVVAVLVVVPVVQHTVIEGFGTHQVVLVVDGWSRLGPGVADGQAVGVGLPIGAVGGGGDLRVHLVVSFVGGRKGEGWPGTAPRPHRGQVTVRVLR